MTSFILKIIAVISMFIDHSGYVIFNRFSFMNYIGRLAFPIFAFLITEGYIHTSNLKKYFSRLLIFAVISQIPYTLLFPSTFTLNTLFTLALGLFALTVYNKIGNKFLGTLFVILSAVLSHFLHFDYGWFGIIIIFIFYVFKNKKIYMNIGFILCVLAHYFYYFFTNSALEYLIIIPCCLIALIPINLYNGNKGKDIKYFLYLFYPLHLIVLYIIKLFL